MVDSGEIKSVTWTETKKQLADCLTKRGSSSFALLKFLETGGALLMSDAVYAAVFLTGL